MRRRYEESCVRICQGLWDWGDRSDSITTAQQDIERYCRWGDKKRVVRLDSRACREDRECLVTCGKKK